MEGPLQYQPWRQRTAHRLRVDRRGFVCGRRNQPDHQGSPTIWGVSFTVVFFAIFTVSERINQRRLDKSVAALDRFTLNYQPDVSLDTVHARPGSVLVAVRDYNT